MCETPPAKWKMLSEPVQCDLARVIVLIRQVEKHYCPSHTGLGGDKGLRNPRVRSCTAAKQAPSSSEWSPKRREKSGSECVSSEKETWGGCFHTKALH